MAFDSFRILLRNAPSLNNSYSLCSEPVTDIYIVLLLQTGTKEWKSGCSLLQSQLMTLLQNVCFLFLPLWALADLEPLGPNEGMLPPGGTKMFSLN